MSRPREDWVSKSGLHKRIVDTDNQYRISQLQQQIITPVGTDPIIQPYAKRNLLESHTRRITTAPRGKRTPPAAVSLASSAARWQSANLKAQTRATGQRNGTTSASKTTPSLHVSGMSTTSMSVGRGGLGNDREITKQTRRDQTPDDRAVQSNRRFNTSRFHMQNPYEDVYNTKKVEYLVNSGMRTWEKNRKVFIKNMEDTIRSRREIQVNTLGPSPPLVTTSVKSHLKSLEEGKKSTRIVSGVPGVVDASSLHARDGKPNRQGSLQHVSSGSQVGGDGTGSEAPASSRTTYYRTYTTAPDIDDGDLDEIQSHPIEYQLGRKITHPLIFRQTDPQSQPSPSTSQRRVRSSFTTCWEENAKSLQDAHPIRATTALERSRYKALARRNIHTSHGPRGERIVNPPNAPKELVAGPSGDILLTAFKNHQLRRKAILGVEVESESSDSSDSELDESLPILPFRETPMNVLTLAPKLKSATIEDAKIETEKIDRLPKAPFARRVQSSTLRRALVPRENWDAAWDDTSSATDENKKPSSATSIEAPKKGLSVVDARPYSAAATLYSRGDHPLLVQARLTTLRGHLQAEVGKRKKAHLAALRKGAVKKR